MKYDHLSKYKEFFVNFINGFMDKPYFKETNPYNPNLIDKYLITNHAYEASVEVANILYALSAYYLDYSPYKGDERLLHFASDTLDFYISQTNSDGSQNLYVTNYHDPNQVGFHFVYISVFELLKKYTLKTELENQIEDKFITVLKNSVNALTTLGFHTPNHRWVQSNALTFAKKYIDDPRIDETLKKYFWEGFDCDENGEYTERSTGVYNCINNEAFIGIFMNTRDYKYLEFPRRNLMLMKSFIEPDLTCNTMNSLRQDAGDSSILAVKYYWQYLVVGTLLQDHELAFMADKFFEKYKESNPELLFGYIRALLFFDLIDNFDELHKKCESYTTNEFPSVFLPNSQIAREYRYDGRCAITICQAAGFTTPDIFKIFFENTTITGRFGSSFFGRPHSQLRPQAIIKNEDGSYSLISHEEQGYRSQFEEPPETNIWRHMDHSKRKWINMQSLDVKLTFKVNEDNIDIYMDASGTENVLSKFELAFSNDIVSKIITKDGSEIFTENGGYIVCNNDFTYYYPYSGIKYEITGGKSSHSYTKDMRGTIPPEKGRYIVAFTGKSPYTEHINIKFTRVKHYTDVYNSI